MRHVTLNSRVAWCTTCVKLAMVLCCFVAFGCSKRSGRDKDDSFYRIPKVMSNKGPELLSLSKRRREGYLKATSRVGLTENSEQ